MKKILQDKLLFSGILKKWPKRIHKKARAKIFIIAGSKGMTGAAALTCQAAYRSGAGLVKLAFPESLLEIYQKILKEVLTLPCPETKNQTLSSKAKNLILKAIKDYDLVVIGPGLSQNKETQKLIQELFIEIKKPIILDADGLNALAKKVELFKKRRLPTVITPHPGEMARLCCLKVNEVQKNREQLAFKKAKEWKVIIVLKGYQTVIAEPSGKIVINQSGGPGLATAGTGDVLDGILAVLWAENLNRSFEAVCTAVYLHGLAGDLAVKKIGERSVIASDVIKYLPEAIKIKKAKSLRSNKN